MKIVLLLPAILVFLTQARGADDPFFSDSYPPARSVQQAVIDFNQLAAANSIGKTQPPLTSDEFLAGLRYALPTIKKDKFVAHVRLILQSGTVPAGDTLDFMTGYHDYNHQGYDLKAWRIQFMLPNQFENGHAVPSLQVVIRQRLLSAAATSKGSP